MRILCIDDDVTFLTMYKEILVKHALPNDEIIVTLDPFESISIIDDKTIDLVITDLIMPKLSGLDVLRTIKKEHPVTEVIVVTGQGSIDSAVDAMRYGARDYLTKPLNYGMLLEKIQNIREFINRRKEVEDYRFAKETVEKNAMKTVNEMEIKLDSYNNLVYRLRMIMNEKISNSDKICKILAQINEIEKEM